MISGEGMCRGARADEGAGRVSAPVSASIAHLKVNGTDTVASLATSSSTIDQITRILRSTRSPGQMYGHRCASVPIRVACSIDLSEEGWAWPAPGDESGRVIHQEPGESLSRGCFMSICMVSVI